MTVTSRGPLESGPLEIGIPDGRLVGEEAGAGDPVVLIHGFSFDRTMWDPQFRPLAAWHRTIRYDLRGFGDSGAPVSGQGHVADLLALLDALSIGRAHLVGLSLGANIALAVAAFHPDRVSSIVLASPGLPGYAWTTPRPPEEAAKIARREGIEAGKDRWLNHEIFRSTESYPAARKHLAEMIARFPARQWTDAPVTPVLPSLTSWLPALRTRTLIVNGALDVAGYREIAAVLQEQIPGATREEYADAGHVLNLEQPARFNRHVLGFLSPG